VVFYRVRSVLALLIWVLSGVAIFFAGWPFLWAHTSRVVAYLSSSVAREAIYVLYWGREYRDSEVPWHYPWVLFAVTVPIGLHALGVCGVWQHWKHRRSDPHGMLYLAAMLFPLLVFSFPGIPVYDGVRLFVMVFPFWAVFVGQGAAWAYERLKERWQPRWAAVAISGLFACQGFGLWHYHPYQLSYYNLLVGGLRGADRLGFEVTYWGDAVTHDLVDRWSALAPQGSCAVLVPSLYTDQGMLYMSAEAERKQLRIRNSLRSTCPYLIVYNRRAYLGELREFVDDASQKPLAENVVDGVWLSRVYARPPTKSARQPDASSSDTR
jgi:hypothetical protein